MKRFKFIFPLLALLLLVTTQCTKEKVTETLSIEPQEEFSTENIQNPLIKDFLTISYLSSVNGNVIPKLKSRNDDELINEVLETLNEQNKQQNFIENMTKKYGFPIWDRSYIYESNNNGRLLLFTPLAFEDGNEITSFIVAIPRNNSYHIELFTKKELDKLINKPKKINDNLIFTVMFCIIADLDIFDNPKEEYVEWFKDNKDNFSGNNESASSRGCTEDVVCANEPVAFTGNDEQTASSRGVICITIVTCDSGSGGGSSCQECGDAGGTGSPGGGSSGSGSTYVALSSNLTTVEYALLNSYNLNEDEIVLLNEFFDKGMFDDDEPINECEKELVLKSPNHAVCAAKFYANSKKAFSVEAQKFGGNNHNGCGDAFRHAYFNALNTRSCSRSMAKEFGDAHECDVPRAESSEKFMDLFNNEEGRRIANENASSSESAIANKICDLLSDGGLLILSDPRKSNSPLKASTGCQCNGV